jgi:hypothetical protein
MSFTLRHLPAGFARMLRLNDAAGLTHLAYRCLPALLAGHCEPTARAVAARYDCNKDTAAKALRSLERYGYLHRWKRSAGRDVWLHFAVLTDDPFSWDTDPQLQAQMATVEERSMTKARDRHYIEAADLGPTIPAPRPPEPSTAPAASLDEAEPQLTSCPGPSDPKTSDIPKKNSRKKRTPPTPSRRGQIAHRPPQRDRYTQRLTQLLSASPELEPHTADALEVLHGLGFPPLERARHARIVASALHSGRPLTAVIDYLTQGLASARDQMRVMRWRLTRLDRVLAGATP